MARKKIEIVYEDGNSQVVKLTPPAVSAAEAKAVLEDWNLNGYRFNMYLIYWQLRHDNLTTDTFDSWLEKVDEINQAKPDPADDGFLDGPKADTAN